jgi:hypothetical protein
LNVITPGRAIHKKGGLSSLRHSKFVIRHSSFVIRHSSFVIRHSSFVIRHSSFVIFPARDVTTIGHFGTGNLELTLASKADVEKARHLIEQSYQAN